MSPWICLNRFNVAYCVQPILIGDRYFAVVSSQGKIFKYQITRNLSFMCMDLSFSRKRVSSIVADGDGSVFSKTLSIGKTLLFLVVAHINHAGGYITY